FAHALFKVADFGRRNHLVVGPDGFLAPLAHQPPPAEHQARREPVTASNVADRHAGLHRLGNDGELQLGGKASPASDAGDRFNLRERIGHRRIPRLMPRSSGYRPCPVETGCTSIWRMSAFTQEFANARIWAGFRCRFSTRVGTDMGLKI